MRNNLPKIVNKENVQREISNKALSVFIKKGYYNTRIEDIAKLCDLSRTSIYQYFKNKDEILIFTLNLQLDEVRDDYFSILNDKTLSTVEKIIKIVNIVFNEYSGRKELMNLVAVFWLKVKLDGDDLLENLRTRTEKLQLVFENLLIEGVDKKEIKPVNTKSMANLLFLLVRGFIVQKSFYKNVSLNDLRESIAVLLQGLIDSKTSVKYEK